MAGRGFNGELCRLTAAACCAGGGTAASWQNNGDHLLKKRRDIFGFRKLVVTPVVYLRCWRGWWRVLSASHTFVALMVSLGGGRHGRRVGAAAHL